jgi:hypothetical protein
MTNEKPEWVRALEDRFGLPFEQIPGQVYILHYDPPQIVKSVSSDYAGPLKLAAMFGQVDRNGQASTDAPITHYVGWTSQSNPKRRIYSHGPIRQCVIASLSPGTPADEEETKQHGKCPLCDEPLCNSLWEVRYPQSQ